MRYVDNKDGTITDNKTGLLWQKSGSDREMNWEDAHVYASMCEDGGYSDWRLPTIEELFSIVDFTRYDPAIDQIFDCSSNFYWSGSTYANLPGHAWVVLFYDGDVYADAKSDDGYVRCVREEIK
jgi:hypothetical protein